MGSYYVYVASLGGVARYVGFGSGPRYKHVNSGVSHVRKLNEQVLKYDNQFEIHFLIARLTKHQACEQETLFIKSIGREDQGTGTLWNTTDGGIGFKGYHTQETKKKISEASRRMWEGNNTTRKEALKKRGEKTRFLKGHITHNAKIWALYDPDNTEKFKGMWRQLEVRFPHDIKSFLHLKTAGKGKRGHWKNWRLERLS